MSCTGRQFDTIEVGRNLTPGGVLEVVLDASLNPQPGDVFQVITAGTMTQDAFFEEVETTGLPGWFATPIYTGSGSASVTSDDLGSASATNVATAVSMGLYRLGDMDLSGFVDAEDAAPFALALRRPEQYFEDYFAFSSDAGDVDEDGDCDFDDIDDFVNRIPGLSVAQVMAAIRAPEPSAIGLAAIGIVGVAIRRRRSRPGSLPLRS